MSGSTSNGSTSKPTVDARQERDLKRALATLWVRFPGSLEDAYIVHALRRARKLIGRSLYVLIVLFLAVTLPVLVFVDDSYLASWRLYGFWPIAGALALLFLAVKVDALNRFMSTLIGMALMISWPAPCSARSSWPAPFSARWRPSRPSTC
ncbi:hypothetical protein HML84_02140 [Alcanivorax sp. IO_7]|nr:hypothetical protein HML84_02140 [Alcanivorax sp. IO_7]